MFDTWIAPANHPPRRVAAEPLFVLLTFASSSASNRVPHAFLTRPTNDTRDLQMGRRNLRRDPAANDDELDLVPGAASVDHDAFALGSNPRGGGDGGLFGAPVAPGSPTQASHHARRRGRTTPRRAHRVFLRARGRSRGVPHGGRRAGAGARARRRRARGGGARGGGVEARRRESTPAALAQRRAADLERRLGAKRKYAELASVVERLAVRAETHGSARDALSAAADAAAEEAREAEREAEKRHDLVERLGRPSPRGGSHGVFSGGALAVGGAV